MHVIKTTLERSLKANTEDDEGFKQMSHEATSVPRLKMNLFFKARGHKHWKVLFLGGLMIRVLVTPVHCQLASPGTFLL